MYSPSICPCTAIHAIANHWWWAVHGWPMSWPARTTSASSEVRRNVGRTLETVLWSMLGVAERQPVHIKLISHVEDYVLEFAEVNEV